MSRYLCVILAFALCCVRGLAESGAVVLDAGFDAFVQQLLDNLHVPGLSLAVVRRDSFESKGYGYAKLPNVEATPDTLWFTGSTTKAFTAAAAALIVHDDIDFPDIAWSSPLASLLPWYFALEDDYYTSHITLEDALSHRSGLPRHDLSYGWDNADAVDVILSMKHLPLTAEPRTRWQYCNLMYATVGQALAMLGNLRFGDMVRKLIWEPIGMTSTTTSLDKAQSSTDHLGMSRLSRGYFWNKDHYLPEPYPDLEAAAGAGATISSVNDYALWIQTLLNAGSNDSSPISDAIYSDMTAARTIMNTVPGTAAQTIPAVYALGWINAMLGSHLLITHSGSVTGFGANVYILPDEGWGVVTMANTMGPSNTVGALIFLEILKRSGKGSLAHEAFHLNQLHESIGGPSKAFQEESRKTKSHATPAQAKLPLPGHLTDYIGLYRHPAYGVYNISLVKDKSTYHRIHAPNAQDPILSAPSQTSLHIQPSNRTWPYEIALKHESDTLFAAELFWVHGQGDVGDECAQDSVLQTRGSKLSCRQGVAFETLYEARAVFERDLSGEITKLGVELEPEMFLSKDESKWRDGMIWFDKQT